MFFIFFFHFLFSFPRRKSFFFSFSCASSKYFQEFSSAGQVAGPLRASWECLGRPAEGGQYADCPPRKVESLQPGGPSGDQLKSVEKQKKKKVGGALDRRTKWCPQAKWRPAEVGGRTSQGSPLTGGPSGVRRPSGDQPKSVVEQVRGAPRQEDQVVSAGKWRPAEVGGGTSRGAPHRRTKWIPPRCFFLLDKRPLRRLGCHQQRDWLRAKMAVEMV